MTLFYTIQQEMILYHQVSNIRLAKGLYLGYLKLQASLELNRVLVPKKAPNILPNIKVRDCPNVSRYICCFLILSSIVY